MSRLLKLIDQFNETRPEGEPPLNKTRLAEAAGISRPTLNAIEQGKSVTLASLRAVSEILGVNVQELIDAA